MEDTEEFNTLAFEKSLLQLKDSQECIQSLSSWCLKQRIHHKKIVSSWLNVLKRVKVDQRLVLFYLANDVIQYSKRKNYEFVKSWGLYLQKATPLVRDDKVRAKILRIFKIWEKRLVYDEEFLSDLTGLLSAGSIKKADDDQIDFQPHQLINKIKQCGVLEADTDMRLKDIHESDLQLSDVDALCASLKERKNPEEVDKELNEGITCMERYTQALQREIVAREALLALLSASNQYYSTQRGEVKVVACAYKNFGSRVRTLKRKLDDLITNLPAAAPSPPPRDEDVPSPGPDEDLELPNASETADADVSYNIDKTFNSTLTADGTLFNFGLSSFLSSENTKTIFTEPNQNANKIEVINNRAKEKQNLNDFLNTMLPNENNRPSENISANKIEVINNRAKGKQNINSFRNTILPNDSNIPSENVSEEPVSYQPAVTTQWNNGTWNMPPKPGYHEAFSRGPPNDVCDGLPLPAPTCPPTGVPAPDIDHRHALPPPPLPPLLPLLGQEPVPYQPAVTTQWNNGTWNNIPGAPPTDIDDRRLRPPPPPPPVLSLLGRTASEPTVYLKEIATIGSIDASSLKFAD